jgi:hypothetical protein
VSWDGCLSCRCQVFRLDTEDCEWFAVCDCCGDEYILYAPGILQLVRRPSSENPYQNKQKPA